MVLVRYKYITSQWAEIEIETGKSGLGSGLGVGKHLERTNNVWDTVYAQLKHTKN